MSKLFALFQTTIRMASLPFEPHDKETTVDAIVVLGAPLRPDGKLSLAGRERVEEGVRLWKKGLAPYIAFTGGAAHSAAEAPAMAAKAQELGVAPAAIIVEDKSCTTAENASFSAKIFYERNIKSIWIVSQPFHLRRGRRLFRKQGFTALSKAFPHSLQYTRPDLAWRWVGREYIAWLVHYIHPGH